MTRTARLGRSSAIITTAAMFLAVLTSCNDGDADNLPPPPATENPTTAAQSTVDPTRQAVLDTYRGSVQAMVVAQAAGDPDHPDLTRYFIERTQAFNDVRNGVLRQGAQGTYYDGDLVVVTAEVTEVDQAAEPPEATVEACLDDSGYRLVNRDDGSPVPDTEPGGRYQVTSQALLGNDDRWYIVESTAHWDEEC